MQRVFLHWSGIGYWLGVRWRHTTGNGSDAGPTFELGTLGVPNSPFLPPEISLYCVATLTLYCQDIEIRIGIRREWGGVGGAGVDGELHVR